VQEILVSWPTKWRAPSKLEVGTSIGVEISVAQKRKEAAKIVMPTLAEKKKKEATKE